MNTNHQSQGTVQAPRYYEGHAEVAGDVRQHQRYFTYQTDGGLVSGTATSVLFTIERPSSEVWPHLQDFNLWQNKYGHYYTSPLGELYTNEVHDLGKQTFRISATPGEPGPHQYQVLRVVPEYGLAIFQPVPTDGSNGGISRGFHMVTLHEHEGKTLVSFLMEHAVRTTDKTEEEALGYWRELAPEWRRKWRESFIPTLKELVYAAGKVPEDR